MYLLEVIPIARGITKESLSYFKREETAPGDIVFVPLRNRTVPALVVSIEPAIDVKARIKASDFSVRKTIQGKTISFLPPEFIEAAKTTAHYTASTTGAVLHATIPQLLFEYIETKKTAPKQGAPLYHPKPGKEVFQAELSERLGYYKSVVRESFARNTSIIIIVPTIADVERIGKGFSRGIQDYVFCFHSGLSKKEGLRQFERLENETHPVLIVATAPFISLMREDITTVILERERSRAYKQSYRPHIDLRFFIEHYAHLRKMHLVLADLPLSIETLWRYEQHELQAVVPPKLRLLSGAEEILLDMREELKRTNRSFEILSDQLKAILLRTVEQNEHCFLFAARRGLAPLTICKDCGSVVMSRDNTVPMVLHRIGEENVFVAHRTGEIRSAHERCRACKSWRLEAMGVGIERVNEIVSEIVPDASIFRVDRDATPTHRTIQKEVEKFYAAPGSILLGTELVIPYLTESIEHSAIVSTDALLALPEWRIVERVFAFVLAIREITTKTFTIQTRRTDEYALNCALTGNIDEFYKHEIEIREEFKYPPFFVLIKISVTGAHPRVTAEIEELHTLLKDIEMISYPTSIQKSPHQHTLHTLLRIKREEWPDQEIVTRLKALPPQFVIDIDPENLL